MDELNLTEELVLAEVQRACDADFFLEHQHAIRKEVREDLAYVLRHGIEALNSLYLLCNSAKSIELWAIREELGSWLDRLILGRENILASLRQASAEDLISRFVFQSIHRLLETGTSCESET